MRFTKALELTFICTTKKTFPFKNPKVTKRELIYIKTFSYVY